MSNHLQPASRVLGSVRADGDGRGTVRMDSVYDTGPDDLWSALTEPPRLARWIATVEGDLRLGGSFSASFTSGQRVTLLRPTAISPSSAAPSSRRFACMRAAAESWPLRQGRPGPRSALRAK